MKQLATIKDVAREANVSVTTVSNVINRKCNISQDTYNRVNEAIKKLDYHPNFYARGLKSSSVKLIGAVIPTLDGIYQHIINGVLSVIASKGYHLIIKNTNDFPSHEYEALDQLTDIGVNGIFIVPCLHHDFARYDKILKQGVPIVFIERNIPNHDYTYVGFDNRNIVFNAVGELLQDGCAASDIMLITGNPEYSSEMDCIQGARLAAEKLCNGEEIMTYSVSHNKEQSFFDITRLFQSLTAYPKHIIVSSEQIMKSLSEVLAMHRVKGIQIHACTGDDWQHFAKPCNLHCIPRPAISCGKKAAELMMEYFLTRNVYEDTHMILRTHMIDVDAEKKRLQQLSSKYRSKRPLRLLLFHFCPMAESLVKLVPSFSAFSGLKVEYEILSDQSKLYKRLLSVYKNKTDEYDVFMIDMPWLDYISSKGFLEPLDNYLKDSEDFTSRFIPGVLDMFHQSNGIYGIPVSCGYQMLLYRKDLFADQALQRMYYKMYGIDLAVPRTWTEYNYIARFFTKSFNKESPLEYGTHLLGAYPNGLVEEFYPRQWAFKGRIADRSGVVINSRANVRALNNLADAMQYSSSLAQDYSNNEHFSHFAAENAALINVYNIDMKSIFDPSFGKVVDHMGFASLPGKYSSWGGWTLAVNGYGRQKDAAFSFIRWATSDDVAVHSTIHGGFVPKQYAFDNMELSNIYPWNEELRACWGDARMREQLKDKNGDLLDAMKIDTIIADAISDTLFHGVPAADALNRAKERIEMELHIAEHYIRI